jgi:hypothetical protein
MSKIAHFLDNRLKDGGKVVNLTHRPRFIHQKHYFSVYTTHFCQRLSEPQDLVQLEELVKLKEKSIHLIGSRTRELPACTIVPRPLRYLVPHNKHQSIVS